MIFNVEKDTATVKFMLEKAKMPKIVAEVIATLDFSGSTKNLYYGGTMQEAIQRVVPVALNFDDNGELPVYGFNDGDSISKLPVLTQTNFAGYVQREIIDNPRVEKWGGTDYAPVFREVLRDLGFIRMQSTGQPKKGFLGRLFGNDEPPAEKEALGNKSTSGLPAIVYHFTDGENEDKKETEALLHSLADLSTPIYFNCIGVGHARFEFLQKIADDLPNVEFTAITDLAKTANSDEIYNHLLPEELLNWLRAYVQ